MNGKNHERLNKNALYPAVFILGYDHIELIISVGFFVWWILHTYFITPDLDTESRPTKRLGLLGWIINKIFKHHGLLHNPIFWAVWFGLQYYYFGWFSLGGVFPIASHLITDKL